MQQEAKLLSNTDKSFLPCLQLPMSLVPFYKKKRQLSYIQHVTIAQCSCCGNTFSPVSPWEHSLDYSFYSCTKKIHCACGRCVCTHTRMHTLQERLQDTVKMVAQLNDQIQWQIQGKTGQRMFLEGERGNERVRERVCVCV